ncbi:MAG: DUF2169 domain-containing protein [Polyangiaceae bacterium]|nr:DUF2169 domain-containing protein [Polyangiaceae bacterium]
MEVVSLCPFRAAGLVWQPRPSAYSLLLVCKGTFDLVPGTSRVAEIQDYPNDEDNHWDDDSQKSLYSASDFVPAKPRADVLLVGHAFAPYGQEVESFVTRFVVGEVGKAIEVMSERVWTMEPRVRYGSRITKAPLRYERAAGGEGTENPVGVPLEATPDAFGMTPLPGLQPAGFTLVRKGQATPPIGYGPMPPTWPSRRGKLGRHAGSFRANEWPSAPLPSDIDPAFWNAAPEDQQVSEIRADERIELVNLHPDIPHLVTTLPGLKPRAFVERTGKPLEEVLLRCDTLWVDTDRQVLTLTWRGQVPLSSREEAGRVLVAMEPPGRTLSFMDIDRLLGRPTGPSEPGVTAGEAEVEWIEPEESGVANRPSGLGGSGPPAGMGPAAAVTLVGIAAVDPAQIGAIEGPSGGAAAPVARPASSHPPASARVVSGAPPASVKIPTVPPVPPRPARIPSAPPPPRPRGTDDAKSLVSKAEVNPGAPAETPKESPAVPAAPPLPLDLSASEMPAPPAGDSSAAGVMGGAQIARRIPSTPPAGAGRFPSGPPGDPDKEFPTEEKLVRPGVPRDGVHILWLDDDADLVAARLGPVATDGAAQIALVSPSRAPSPPRSLTAALEAAIGMDSRFEPPAVTLTGDLTLVLSPLDRLRALMTLAHVLEPGDERASALRTKGERLLAGASPEGASWLAGRIADDLEAALAARAGASDSLAGMRRALHATRAYTRVLVLGGRHVRGILRDAGGANLAVYISEAACVHLPLDERFRARVVGELHPRIDATDPAPYALRVAGIARILTVR